MSKSIDRKGMIKRISCLIKRGEDELKRRRREKNGKVRPAEEEIIPWPSTPLEAAKVLINALSPEDMIAIANMGIDEVAFLNLSLGNDIRNNFGLWEGNVVLMQACAEEAERETLHQDEASAVILARLALEAQKAYKLR